MFSIDIIPGLSESNSIFVKLLMSNEISDVKKLYDTNKNLYEKIKSN